MGLKAAAGAAEPPPGEPLSLSIAEAVVGSLANNRSLEVQRIVPEIARTGELSAEAPFDTTVDGRLSGASTRSPQGADAALDDQRRAAA